MTAPLGVSAFSSLGAVPIQSGSAPLGVSAFSSLGAVPVSSSDIASQQTAPAQSFASKAVNAIPGLQETLGAGDAIRNTMASFANLVPGVNIKPVQSGTGTAYQIGNIAGNAAAFMGGGDVLDVGRALSESAPYIGKAAQLLGQPGFAPSMARRAIGSGLYGAGTAGGTPSDKLSNAEKGVLLSVAGEGIPGTANVLKMFGQYFMPQKYAQGVIKSLGDGQNLSDATQSVIKAVQNSYKSQVKEASNAYTNFLGSVPSGNIYATVGKTSEPSDAVIQNLYSNFSPSGKITSVSPGMEAANTAATGLPQSGNIAINPENVSPLNQAYIGGKVPGGVTTPSQTFSFTSGQYPSLPEKITDTYVHTTPLDDLHSEFINNPTFDNAHALQSELGVASRALEGGNAPITMASRHELNSINIARQALKNDMDNFLTNVNPELSDRYQNISNDYYNNVVPYKANPKIYALAKGTKTNVKPSTLADIFSAPDTNMTKVTSDLPQGITDKILYTKLGQTVPNKSAQGLLNSYQNLQQQGLGNYISPSLVDQMGELETRIKARTGLQLTAAALAGAGLGVEHGAPLSGAVLGFGTGAISSPFLNYIARRHSMDNIGKAISNVLRGTYPAGRSAVIANMLNNSGVQNGS